MEITKYVSSDLQNGTHLYLYLAHVQFGIFFPRVSLRFRAGSGEHVAPAENTLNVPNHMKIVKHVAPDLTMALMCTYIRTLLRLVYFPGALLEVSGRGRGGRSPH